MIEKEAVVLNSEIPIIIREARPEDAGEIVEYITRLAAEPDVDIILSPGEFTLTADQEGEILADFAASDNSIYLVAEAEGTIVGILSCKGGARRAVRHAATLSMSVAREWRDRGIGGQLMEYVIGWGRGNDVVRRIELNVMVRNARARHLYEKLGFVVEGRRSGSIHRNGEDLDDLLMALMV
jgi:ribosomal protein S18 acetylase RimI-like enzyme